MNKIKMGRKKDTLVQAEFILSEKTKEEAISYINDLKNMTMNSKRIAYWNEVLENVHKITRKKL